MSPPTGQDSLAVRQAYFHHQRALSLGGWSALVAWIMVATVIGSFVVVGIVGISGAG